MCKRLAVRVENWGTRVSLSSACLPCLVQPQLTCASLLSSGGLSRVSQVALVVKNLTANAGDIRDVGSILGSGRPPGGGHGNPLQYSCLENPHGQRSLEGYSPKGHKESDITEAT